MNQIPPDMLHVAGTAFDSIHIADLTNHCVAAAACELKAVGTVSLALAVSNRRHCYHCHSSLSVSDSALRDCTYSLRDAFQCIAQPKTA